MGFNEIKGQNRAIKILKQAISNNHLSQTYLFHGPDGVGKKKVAISFAKTLNCKAGNDDACGLCISCRKIGQGIHPDVTLLEQDKGEIKIGAIRDIINGMVYSPLEGKKRVIIVDEADRFNISASNAFLKTLEEPPPETIIILVSSSPDTLPQTVLSRCHNISFCNVPISDITDILMQEHGLARETAGHAACLADGSLSRAIALSSAAIQQIREDILAGLMGETLKGSSHTKGYNNPSPRGGEGKGEGGFSGENTSRTMLFDLSERFSKDEAAFYDALYWTFTYLRDIMILKAGGDLDLLINKDLHNHLSTISDRVTVERLLDIMNFIQSVYRGQERNMNKQLALDVLGMKLIEEMV